MSLPSTSGSSATPGTSNGQDSKIDENILKAKEELRRKMARRSTQSQVVADAILNETMNRLQNEIEELEEVKELLMQEILQMDEEIAEFQRLAKLSMKATKLLAAWEKEGGSLPWDKIAESFVKSEK